MNLLAHNIVVGKTRVYQALECQTIYLSTSSGHRTVDLFDDDSSVNLEGSSHVHNADGAQNTPTSGAATEIGAIRAPAHPMHSVPVNSGRKGGGQPALKTGSEKKVPKPHGQAGKDFLIAEKMGLAGSRKKRDRYNALLRSARDLTLNAHLPFERSWCDIPAASKATLFAVAQDVHPFLSHFENDWATEAIVHQYMKNKRKTLYKAGSLEKPKGYKYLKENAAKRDQSKSHKKTATKNYEANKLEHKKAKEYQRHLKRISRKVMEDEENEQEKGDEFIQGSSRDGDEDVDMADEENDNDIEGGN
ncbi:uncharacterized protein EV420DRAFT_1473526 [Desarmillaria tabescens]|uniref:Uncharacterized protein n=1 Tax=Armillaria tabescens TaxID=1929756 RepID=A0AA39NRG6_ARMTA|nr:uncharacterized protein EV420DRAFT_1473526 [Desarmillaria tabescens]KAK0470470.1 hypothetical protein EV420DRAFT_1473526 [Desarmillaria tabescens]